MEQETASPKQHSNSYNIFILVLTVLSLAVMAAMLFPISEETRHLLSFYDNLICIIFLVDFFRCLESCPQKIGLLYQAARLAGPARLDPFLWDYPIRGTVTPGPAEPFCTHHPADERKE